MNLKFVDQSELKQEVEPALVQQDDLLQRLAQISARERQTLLIAYIQEQVAKAVGINSSQLDVQQPLKYLGIDSLIAVKLRNKLRNDLEVDIPAVKFMGDLSVVSIANLALESTSIPQEKIPNHNVYTSKSYPLTYGQKGLWFFYKMAPQSATYNIAFTARICSDLNIPALQRAFQKLIERHPTLRTTFGQQDGEPFQEVHQDVEVVLEIVDASTWDEEELTRKAIAAYKHPFDLERGPLFRVNLFTCSAQDHLLVLTIHHIAVDGFSFGILLDDLRLLYESENTGKTISLEPIKGQYWDFVQWQEKILKSPLEDSQWTYWQKQFSGELPLVNLPTDRPRPPSQSYEGASYTFEINKELTYKLRKLGKAEGATLYMTLLSVFYVLLYRYTGQEDIIVASPIDGRSQSKFTRTVGDFTNILIIRVNLAGNIPFSELLSQVRQKVLSALNHQDYPSPLLIDRLHVNRDFNLAELFRVSLNLLPFHEMAPEYELSVSAKTKPKEDWGGLELKPFVIPQQEGQNDISFNVIDRKESLLGILKYNTDIFDATTISRMAEHFQNLLEGVVADREQRISSLPLLRKEERDRLLLGWNDTQVEYPKDKCIHQLFEEQVEKTPNAVAVVFENQQLTYVQLNQRANQLAHHLQSLGVGPEVLVGICVERSLEMVVGLLGILKAGGAYVPLDPSYPAERLADILADASAPIVVTKASILASLSESQAQVVCIDRDWDTIAQESLDNPTHLVNSSHLVYVIFTSGSTGKPKGAGVFHRGFTNLLWWYVTEFNLAELERVLLITSFSFDLTQKNIYAPLISGGTLHILPSGVYDPQNIIQQIDEHAIAWVNCTPSMFYTLLDILGKDFFSKLSSLRYVLLGGEPIQVSILRDWLKSPECKATIVNTYGPTECTDVCAFYRLDQPENFLNKSVPIGHSIPNTQLIVLDNNHNLMPIGVVGELCIAGTGVGLGYINNKERTAKQFILNPFGEGYLYKTGDLARYLPDGNIEFLGRIDHQVKIRGFRIELGEIESILNTHPQIQQTVVIATEELPGNKRLVAYVVTSDESLTTKQLCEFLKEKLPEYMVPSAFVTLDGLPLTPNGKVDRKALPEPDGEITREQEYVAPRTPSEEILANIFANVLGVQKVGIHDNFFDLGGHSLLATQVISRIRQAFAVDVPLRNLFEEPTIANLSKIIENSHSLLLQQLQITSAEQLENREEIEL